MSESVDPQQPVPVALSPYDKDKITILPGASAQLDAVTFDVKDEDHTLGNALRWMVMKDPDVEFCGYSMPHPSEAKFHLRIQMYNGRSALTCLLKALANLRALLLSLKDGYADALATDSYIRAEDVDVQAEVARILAAHHNSSSSGGGGGQQALGAGPGTGAGGAGEMEL